jgi:putative ABC transport system substrate-binding protein
MRRRDFLATGLFGAAMSAALSRGTWAQQSMPVIGYLGLAPAANSAFRINALKVGLGDLGFVDGKDVKFELRWANGSDQLGEFAADLVERRVTVIVSNGNAASLAVKSATSTIPTVFASADDPVRLGLVVSFNRPGGNRTGLSLISGSLGAKRLELVRELVPSAVVIAMLRNPTNPAEAERNERAAADALGQQIVVQDASTESDLESAFAKLNDRRVGAVLVPADAIFTASRDIIVALAARYKIPAIYPWREYAEAGGLMSYGPPLTDSYRQMGVYVGKILRGIQPADLPVIQPTRLELVINLKTAKALGLAIPAKVLALADAVIE